MNNIDPISKEFIKEENLVIINNNNFDIYNLLEWFLFNTDWVDPTTNLIYRYENINFIINYIIQNKILFDFLTNENFKIFGVYNLSKLKNIYRDYKVYDKNSIILKKKITNDERILKNHNLKKERFIKKSKNIDKINESILKKEKKIKLNLKKNEDLLNFYKKKYILKNN